MSTPLIVIVVLVVVIAAWWVSRLGERGPGRTQQPVHPPLAPTPENIQALVVRGEKMQAIKMVRAYSGLGLKESKDLVDGLARGESISFPPTRMSAVLGESPALPEEINQEITRLIAAGQVIDAIKLHREGTGAGLKESKDAIDRIRADLEK